MRRLFLVFAAASIVLLICTLWLGGPPVSVVHGQSSGIGSGQQIIVPNAASTGTTVNTLTKLSGAPSTALISSTSDTSGAVGITIAGAGTSGAAVIQTVGIVPCVFSGATTAGHYVQISTATAGNCLDSGAATFPTSGQVIGRVLSTNGSGGTYLVDLFASEIQSYSNGGVASFSGDGTLIVNSASTGAVTATLGTAGAYTFFSNNTSSTGAPGYHTLALAAFPTISNATFLSNVSGGTAVPSANALPTTANALIETSNTNGALSASNFTDNGTTGAYGSDFSVTLATGILAKIANIATVGLGVPVVGWKSNVTGQSTSQSSVTLASSPAAGDYLLSFYADLNTPCSTGANEVSFSFNWTDASNARVLQTGYLMMGAAQATGSILSGVQPIHVGSGSVTYTSTVSGTCATGTSTYDVNMWLARAL